MNTKQAFLSDIRAHPDDDTPRLIYADWLDEHGESPRAEFIRVQIELTRIAPTDDRVPELHLRQLQLLAEHEREWLGPWTDRLVRWQFQRGMLHEVTIEPEPFVDSGNALLASHPVHTIAFVDNKGESLAPDAITRVLAVPHIGLVRGLELSGCRPKERMDGWFGGEIHTSVWLSALAGANHVTRLELVNLHGGTNRGRGAIEFEPFAAFCASPHLVSLHCLDLSKGFRDEGPNVVSTLCEQLATATFAPSLRRLMLSFCNLTEDDLGYLTASKGLRGLESVDLTGCEVGGLGEFLVSRPPGRLTELGITCGFDLPQLADWPGLRDLKTLLISETHGFQRDISNEDWLRLFLSPNLRPTHLSLAVNDMPYDGIKKMICQKWISQLRAITLMGSLYAETRFDVEIAALLLQQDLPWLHAVNFPGLALMPRNLFAAWPVLPQLTQFAHNGEEGFAPWMLSEAPLTPRVSRMGVWGHQKDETLAHDLATSQWTQGITHLDFGYNNLTANKVSSLAAAPFARYLESLHLGSENGQDALAAMKAIADDRNFPRLRDIVVGSDTIEGGIAVLRNRFKSRLRVFPDD